MFLDREQIGQSFGTLKNMADDVLMEVLPTHGFPMDSIDRLRADDRIGLIESRLKTLIDGEREFMKRLDVTLPAAQVAATIADSDVTDDAQSEIDSGEAGTDVE